MKTNRWASTALALLGSAFVLSGCHTDMFRQPKAVAQETTDFWPDGQVERPRVEGTVARGGLQLDDQKFKGRENGKLTTKLPAYLVINGERLSTTTDLDKILEKGRERYNVFCRHCHGVVGDGKGMIAIRGLKLRRNPASYHSERLRDIPIGHFYDVITNGFGAMYSYKSRIEPDERWAIAAYIRVLQASQNVSGAEVPAEHQEEMNSKPSEGTESNGH